MKTTTLIIALLACFLFSCENSNVKTQSTEYRVGNYIDPIKLVEIDSCEYLFGDWANATVLTHKGNCKYCAERNKAAERRAEIIEKNK